MGAKEALLRNLLTFWSEWYFLRNWVVTHRFTNVKGFLFYFPSTVQL